VIKAVPFTFRLLILVLSGSLCGALRLLLYSGPLMT
jgi:hypothetical protein